MVEHYKEYPEYHSELEEYGTRAFLNCFDEVTHVISEKGLDATLPIIAELKSSLVHLEPAQKKIIGPSLGVI